MHQQLRVSLVGDHLKTFNRRWHQRYQVYLNHCPPPWWSAGLILNKDIHYNYERFLPVTEYIYELRHVLTHVLPDFRWTPQTLKTPAYPSIASFWEQLPQHLSGKVTWEIEELLPLACTLASPRKNGCYAGRYPEQTSFLQGWLENRRKKHSVNTIDFGCSTGQVTYEVVAILDKYVQTGNVIGVTKEPLEAWMATNQCLPHLQNDGKFSIPSLQKYAFPLTPQKIKLYFVAGDVQCFNLRLNVDIIICNGLVGGASLKTHNAFLDLWEKFSSQLAPQGILMLGSRFHDGFKQNEHRFIHLRPKHMNLVHATHYISVFASKNSG